MPESATEVNKHEPKFTYPTLEVTVTYRTGQQEVFYGRYVTSEGNCLKIIKGVTNLETILVFIPTDLIKVVEVVNMGDKGE